ncbi:MAG: DUF4314 domain-containing protein [Nitrososphaeraceae archaeon]
MSLSFNMNIPDIVGKRVELVHTDDPYTKLKPGDRDTASDISEIPFDNTPYQIWINWDNHVIFALLPGHDRYEIVEDEKIA